MGPLPLVLTVPVRTPAKPSWLPSACLHTFELLITGKDFMRMWSIRKAMLLIFILTAGAAYAVDPADRYEIKVPAGLKPLAVPPDNPVTAAKVELGRQLYFDPRL